MVNRQIAPGAVFTVQDLNRPKDVENSTDFETAIKLCGYGRYHYGFILLCGMMFLCVGCQNGINAYILPSAECDLRLSSEEKGLLNVAFLVGGVISSIFWGVFADAYGRKNILVGTLIVDGLLTLVSSLSQSFRVLLVFRTISGFTIGAPGSLIYTYLGEFHAAKQRVKSICYVGFFWTLSWLILPGLAWIIIPIRMKWQHDDFIYNSWRLYLAVIGLPTLLVAAVLTRYPESPKFLLSRGKSNEALEILRDIWATNVGRARSEYPVKCLASLDEGEYSEKTENNNAKDSEIRTSTFGDTCNERRRVGGLEHDSTKPSLVLELISNVYRQMRSLGSPPLFKWAILCWTIYFTNMFGYYGLGLWLPELFNRFENYYKLHPNVSVSVCELVAPINETVSEISPFNCDDLNIDERVFVNTLTINGVCLLGNIVSGYLADRVGRRTIPVTTMLLAGFAGFAIYFVRSSAQNLIVACVYSLTITTANFVVGSIVVDIFPTHIGAVAICMMTCFGRIGAIASNLAFGMLLDISCEVPIFLVGAIVVFEVAKVLAPKCATGKSCFMFMFWSKRAVLTRRLLKAKVRGEHETECETQGDTLSRINVHDITDNNLRAEVRRTERARFGQTASTGSSNNRGYSVANRFHQGCCGGDYSHDDDDDYATKNSNDNHQQHQQQQQQQRFDANRLTRCKELLKSLKENQLEMLLNVVENYGADFGSCVLVPRKKPENTRNLRINVTRDDSNSTPPDSPSLGNRDMIQDCGVGHCNRHKRCGFGNFVADNGSSRRLPHRHILRSRRHHQHHHHLHHQPTRCSRCANSHVNEEQRAINGHEDSSNPEVKSIENLDNEMNLRLVDNARYQRDNAARIDDRRQEEPAWSPNSRDPRSSRNLDISGTNNEEVVDDDATRPLRDRCRLNNGKSGRSTSRTRKRRDSSSTSNGDCNSSSDSSLEQPPDDPHLLSCQIWRWPDLANSAELKKLPVCHSAKDPVYVCCNPYHWSRLCKPESPPPPYCLIPDRLRPEDRAPSEISGDYRRCGIATSQQPHSGSLTTNGEGGDEMGQKEWCTLAYWELGGRVGRLYPVEPLTVNVFDSLHDGDGLCLATLAENHVASPAVQRTRSKIGLGLMLSQESDGVWAYNRSESPIFVNSPTLDDPESRTLLVYRVPPGFCLNIFDRAKTIKLPRCMGQGSPISGTFNSGPVDVNSVRISFAKGWGPKYSRQEVTSCPCWLEVLLAPCR